MEIKIVFLSLFCRVSENLILKSSVSFLNVFFTPITQVNVVVRKYINLFQGNWGQRQKICDLCIWTGAEIYTCMLTGGSDLVFILLKIKDHLFASKFKKNWPHRTDCFSCGTWTVGHSWSRGKQWKNSPQATEDRVDLPLAYWNLNFTREMMAERG